jgi:tungstate transport system permease protein
LSSNYIGTGFKQAWHLIATHDPLLYDAFENTLKVLAVSTTVAAVLGIPLGVLLALGRFRGRGIVLAIANAGLGLPPVLVGIVLALLFFPAAPLGPLHLLNTLEAIYIAQSVLAFPVVVALTASAVNSITPGLLDQARGFHAPLYRIWLLALREARIGIIAAIVAAAGTALSEVAAVVLVGGNTEFYTQTLGSLALQQVGAGQYIYGFAVGIILLALILLVSGILTMLQYVGRRSNRARR